MIDPLCASLTQELFPEAVHTIKISERATVSIQTILA